ncbi:MAG: hypothetical protein JRE92_00545 [Deltaproteobacteria bacterium]|jgi:hypothetical protein|nr:hypothetical protein [Deltaproteobacteria bacterium]
MKNAFAFVCILSFLCTPLGSALADKGFSVKDVRGNYGFSFQGQIVEVGPVAAVGLITADGRGNVTEAVRTISINGVPVTETFTCTITVNPDGTGSAVCPLDDPLPGAPPEETFDFVLEHKARAFRLVGTTPGIVVVGSGRKQ